MSIVKPTEAKLRRAVAIGLWSMSGMAMAIVFVAMAGGSGLAWVGGAVWAGLLTASAVLNYRRGGNYRFVTWGIEVLLIVSALLMAYGRIHDAQARTSSAQLGAVKETRPYKDAMDAWNMADKLQKADESQLEGMPKTWITLSAPIKADVVSQQAEKLKQSKIMGDLESNAAKSSANGLGGAFSALGGWSALIAMFLAGAFALMTDISAMVLTSGARETLKEDESQPERTFTPAAPVRQSRLQKAEKPTVEDYLREALNGKTNGPLLGRSAVAERLGITESEAKELFRKMIEQYPSVRVVNRRAEVAAEGLE